MTPLKLTIQAFGPFANTETIDFTELGNNPIFLINGNTGSGKSSLLDAICFAMYGETTGKERDATQMRCDFSKPTLLTQITFEFALGTSVYRIERSPKQEIQKANGDGTTGKAAQASMWGVEKSGELTLISSKKVGEVNEKVKALIGLNAEQFRQVMVLPQGQFRKLLLADSKDRESIFSQLFQTQMYKKIEDKIVEQARSVTQQREDLQKKVSSILEGVEQESEQDAEIRLSEIEVEYKALTERKNTLANQLEMAVKQSERAELLSKQFGQFKTVTEQLEVLQSKQPSMTALELTIKQAREALVIAPENQLLTNISLECEKAKDSQKVAKETSEQAEEREKHSSQQFKDAESERTKVDRLNIELVTLQEKATQFKSFDLSNVALIDAKKAVKTASSEVVNVQEHLTALAEKQLDVSRQQTALEPLLSQETAVSVSLNQLQQTLELAGSHAVLAAKITACQMQSEQVESQVQLLQEAVSTKQEQVNQLEMNWHLGQAALLAENLQQGSPCPVCASQTHIALAQWPEGTEQVSKSQVDTAKNELKTNQVSLSATDKEWGALKAELSSLERQLSDVTDKLGKDAAFSMENLQDRQLTLQQEMKAITVGKQSDLDYKQLISALNTDKESLSSQLPSLDASLTTAKETYQACEIEHKRLQAVLGDSNIESLQTSIKQMSAEIDTILGQYDDAQKSHKTALAQYASAIENAKNTQEQYQLLIEKQVTQKKRWETLFEESSFDELSQFEGALLESSELKSIEQEIELFNQNLHQVTGQVQSLQSELEDKNPPNLEVLQETIVLNRQEFKQAEEEWSASEVMLKDFINSLARITKLKQKGQSLEEEFKVIGTLSNVLTGKEGDKVNLQRFVLGVLLDDVLYQASQRLKRLSKGRYELSRKVTQAKQGAASGLELEVVDGYSEKTRPVATLSGGESFLAALSLALGLSDVVQAYSGGIRLETLFIDEGFGSLDPESLDLAIETLNELHANGRTIGVISHVTELKEQMPLRIDVKGSPFGSTIKLIA